MLDVLDVLDQPQGPSYRLEVDPPDAGEQDPAVTRFYAPDGFLIWPGPSETVRDGTWLDRLALRLSGLVDAEYRYLGVLEMASVTGDLQVTCTFQTPTPEELVQGSEAPSKWSVKLVDADVKPLGAGSEGHSRGPSSSCDFEATFDPPADGSQLVRIDVANQTDEPLFFSVLSVTEAREINVIYPGEGSDFRILPHHHRPVYATLTRHEGFAPGVPMRDRYLAIATRERANFFPLVQRSTNRGWRGDLGAMPAVIANALSTGVTRGGSRSVKTSGGPAFGIATVDLLVDTPVQK